MTDHVLVTVEDGVQIVTINRPDKKNALTAEMYKVLADAIEVADADPKIRVTYYTGTGGSLHGGQRPRRLRKGGHDAGGRAADGKAACDALPRKPRQCRKAHCGRRQNGLAVGVGVTMLLHCDLVYAGTSATFQMPFGQSRSRAEAASTFLLQRQIGIQKAADLFLTGKKIDAAKAEAVSSGADVFRTMNCPSRRLPAPGAGRESARTRCARQRLC